METPYLTHTLSDSSDSSDSSGENVKSLQMDIAPEELQVCTPQIEVEAYGQTNAVFLDAAGSPVPFQPPMDTTPMPESLILALSAPVPSRLPSTSALEPSRLLSLSELPLPELSRLPSLLAPEPSRLLSLSEPPLELPMIPFSEPPLLMLSLPPSSPEASSPEASSPGAFSPGAFSPEAFSPEASSPEPLPFVMPPFSSYRDAPQPQPQPQPQPLVPSRSELYHRYYSFLDRLRYRRMTSEHPNTVGWLQAQREGIERQYSLPTKFNAGKMKQMSVYAVGMTMAPPADYANRHNTTSILIRETATGPWCLLTVLRVNKKKVADISRKTHDAPAVFITAEQNAKCLKLNTSRRQPCLILKHSQTICVHSISAINSVHFTVMQKYSKLSEPLLPCM